MENEIERLKEIFQSHNIPIPTIWLVECREWCKNQVLRPNYTFEELRHAIHDQWLSFDLRELGTPFLPPNLSKQKHMILQGNYSVQLMQVVDISKPKYWQLQQIRKQNILTRPPKNEINESVGTGKRVLQLTLSDGVQIIEAMEYKPINCLNINLKPGSKVRLLGPIVVRRGRLMLQEKNIHIEGGEIEDLLIPNAAENVLARFLNLPENPNPQMVDVNLLDVNQDEDGCKQQQKSNSNMRNHQNIPNSNINNTNRNNNSRSTNNDYSYERNHTESNSIRSENTRNINNGNNFQTRNDHSRNSIQNKDFSHNNHGLDDGLDDVYKDEIEMLMEIERGYQNEPNNESTRNEVNKTPDLFEDDFDADQIEHIIEAHSKENSTKNKIETQPSTALLDQRNIKQIPQTSKSSNKTSHAHLFDEFINEDDLFGNLDADPNEEKSKSDVITITKLLQNIQKISVGVFKIHAKFKSVAEKLMLKNEEYTLTIVVEDESNELVCRVHSDIVSKWVGLTPQEISKLKMNIAMKEVEAQKKIHNALENIKVCLLEINHQMEIQIDGKDKVPIIRDISY